MGNGLNPKYFIGLTKEQIELIKDTLAHKMAMSINIGTLTEKEERLIVKIIQALMKGLGKG